MMVEHISEKAALDKIADYWMEQGYTVVKKPNKDELPPFLKRYRPAAIAYGKDPSLIIEVVNPRARFHSTKISQIQSLIPENSGWKLEVVYTSPDTPDLPIQSKEAIVEALDKAKIIADIEPRAALVFVWSTFEALARTLNPEVSTGVMSPSTLIDFIVSVGYVDYDSQHELRSFAMKRNAIAHGQLDIFTTPQDVYRLINVVEEVLMQL